MTKLADRFQCDRCGHVAEAMAKVTWKDRTGPGSVHLCTPCGKAARQWLKDV